MALYQINPSLASDIFQARILVCKQVNHMSPDIDSCSYVCDKTIFLAKTDSIKILCNSAFARLHKANVAMNYFHLGFRVRNEWLYLIPWDEQIYVGFFEFRLFPKGNNAFPDLVPIS